MAEMFDVTEHTLRFYTDKGLLPCERDGGNRRVFNEESVNWMQRITGWKKQKPPLNIWTIKWHTMKAFSQVLSRMTRSPKTGRQRTDRNIEIMIRELQKEYPWAKGIVIVSFWYGKYRIPDNVQECRRESVIQKACFDEYAEVRDMAKWILEILENENIN